MNLKKILNIGYIKSIEIIDNEKLKIDRIDDILLDENILVIISENKEYSFELSDVDLSTEYTSRTKVDDIFFNYSFSLEDEDETVCNIIATDILDSQLEEKVILELDKSSKDYTELKEKYLENVFNLCFDDFDFASIKNKRGKDKYDESNIDEMLNSVNEMLNLVNIYNITSSDNMSQERKRIILKYLQVNTVLFPEVQVAEIFEDLLYRIYSKFIYNSILKTDEDKIKFEEFKKLLNK